MRTASDIEHTAASLSHEPGRWQGDSFERGNARINVELSGVSESSVEIGQDAKAPVFRKLRQRFDGPFEAGKPIIILAVDANEPADEAVAYVTRIELRAVR